MDSAAKDADVFSNPARRKERVILHLKVIWPEQYRKDRKEPSWLNDHAAFLENIRHLLDQPDSDIEYTCDGLTVTYQPEHLPQAIETAVNIQKSVAKMNLGEVVVCDCSIGISKGKVMQIPVVASSEGDQDLHSDYIGEAIYRAVSFCEVSNSSAIRIDETCCSLVRELLSGNSPDSKTAAPLPLLGAERKLYVERMKKHVPFYRFHWSPNCEDDPATASTDRQQSAHAEDVGNLHRWEVDENHGFIRTSDGRFFYTNPLYVAQEGPIEPGSKLFFLIRQPLEPARNPVAACVLALGGTTLGRVIGLSEGKRKRFGFVQVADMEMNARKVYMALGDNEHQILVGDHVLFTVGENSKGPIAKDVKLLRLVVEPGLFGS